LVIPCGASLEDQRMMKRAMQLARTAGERGEVPVGAVIYRAGVILSEASNDREASGDPTGHAEVVALRLAAIANGGWRLNDCSMAVTLEPCPMCAGALVNARVSRLLYGARDPKAGAVDTLYDLCRDPRLNHRMEVIGGLMGRECGSLLTNFFRARRLAKRANRPSNA
jgi:tRNA(adenine34) deaminase